MGGGSGPRERAAPCAGVPPFRAARYMPGGSQAGRPVTRTYLPNRAAPVSRYPSGIAVRRLKLTPGDHECVASGRYPITWTTGRARTLNKYGPRPRLGECRDETPPPLLAYSGADGEGTALSVRQCSPPLMSGVDVNGGPCPPPEDENWQRATPGTALPSAPPPWRRQSARPWAPRPAAARLP